MSTQVAPIVKAFSIVYVKPYGQAQVLGITRGGVVVTIINGKHKGCTFTARFSDIRA